MNEVNGTGLNDLLGGRKKAHPKGSKQLAKLEEKVSVFFFKDKHKSDLWWATPNPMLGGSAPAEMVRRGRINRLAKFIDEAMTHNDELKGGRASERPF